MLALYLIRVECKLVGTNKEYAAYQTLYLIRVECKYFIKNGKYIGGINFIFNQSGM